VNRRTRTETVTFARRFALAGLDEILPPGAYEVELDEELVDGLSFAAYRKVLAVIHLQPSPRHPGLERTLSVDPSVLEAALARDRATGG
jgi:hypothetical protein